MSSTPFASLIPDDDTMSPIAVLIAMEQADRARRWLIAQGWDIRRHRVEQLKFLVRTHHRIHLTPSKSWDVARFAVRLRRDLSAPSPIIDVGGMMSELPWVLHLAGYQDITACDLDPRVLSMPYRRAIKYRIGEPQDLEIGQGTISAITAVSTIEHGIDLERFFRWAAATLVPAGLLCLSTDYWPEKIATDGLGSFGLPWSIFSTTEIVRMIELAEVAGLELDGWDGKVPDTRGPVVEWNGKSYTFIALVFTKSDR